MAASLPVKVENGISRRYFEKLLAEMQTEFSRMQQQIDSLGNENLSLRSNSRELSKNPKQPTVPSVAPAPYMATGDAMPNFDTKSLVRALGDTSPDPASAIVVEGEGHESSNGSHGSGHGHGQDEKKPNGKQKTKEEKAQKERKTQKERRHSLNSTDSERGRKLEEETRAHQMKTQQRQWQFERIDRHGHHAISGKDISACIRETEEELEEMEEDDDHHHDLDQDGMHPEQLADLLRFVHHFYTPVDKPKRFEHHEEPRISLEEFANLMDSRDLDHSDDITPANLQSLVLLRAALLHEANDHRTKVILEAEREKLKAKQMRGKCAVTLDVVSVVVIVLNSLAIGFSVDVETDHVLWKVLEVVFFAYYVGEIAFKLYLFGGYMFVRGPDWAWNLFDSTCVALSIIDLYFTFFYTGDDESNIGSLMLIKLFRMARLARLIRIVRFKFFKELKLILLGLFSGLRALTWAILLLVAIIYALGICMRSVLGNAEPEFASVPAAMFTLFRCFTDGCSAYDGTPLTERLRNRFGGIAIVLWIFLSMLVTVGIFNLIMAVFIDNVTKSQQQRKQKELGETSEMVEADLKLHIAKFILHPDHEDEDAEMTFVQRLSEKARLQLSKLTDDDGVKSLNAKIVSADAAFTVLTEEEVTITRDVFHSWLCDKEFIHVLEEADVDISNKFELFDILDVDMGGELSAEELVHGLLKLRGDVSKGDIVSILLKVVHLTKIMEDMRKQEANFFKSHE